MGFVVTWTLMQYCDCDPVVSERLQTKFRVFFQQRTQRLVFSCSCCRLRQVQALLQDSEASTPDGILCSLGEI